MAIDKVVYEFDPFELIGMDAPADESARKQAIDQIAEYVKTEILQYVGDGETPVDGGHWKKKLSAEYAKEKEKHSSADFANMEESGAMLDALETRIVGDKIQVGIWGEQAAKADGHNNFSGKSKLPERDFIPKPGHTFVSPIIEGIKNIAESFMEDTSGL